MNLSTRLIVLIVLAAGCARLDGDPLYDAFREPDMNTRPFVRWWWNGGRVDANELVRELDMLKAAGVGGVEINTIGMPEEASASSLAAHPEVPWLSPEWDRLVALTAAAARARGMTTDVIVGSGWPFGGRFLEPEEQTQRVFLVKRTLHGPSQAAFTRTELEQLTPVAKPGEHQDPRPVPTSNRLLFLRLLPAGAERGSFAPGRDLMTAFVNDDRLVIDVPAGDFLLYVGTWQTGFTHVKLGAPGADGPVVNHFDAAAVRKYLDHMSSSLSPALHGNLGSALRAMFVDSLELDRANWTGDFAAEFIRRRGYDILPYLPFVLDEDNARSTSDFNLAIRRARYDFDKTLIELFDERFISTYVAWADANHVKARIQAYGREIHPLHGSMKAELPEGETWLWLDPYHPKRIRVEPTVVDKYVASAANLTGQRLRSFEAMTNAVPVFRETLQDFKRGLDATLLTGLNHPIMHGFNYTPLDAGFPGWVRFGNYLNERTPWWPYFKLFSDYAARLGTVMRHSDARARIAVLAPRPDEWSKYGLLIQPFPEVADPWYQFKLIDAVQQAGYNADYISEKILTDGKRINGQLRYGPCAYDLLILEEVGAMEPAAAAALAEFAAGGGRVIFIGDPPSHAPGLWQAAQNDSKVQAAISQIRNVDTARIQDQVPPAKNLAATEGGDEQHLVEFASDILARTGLPPDVRFAQPRWRVSQISQRDNDRCIYFVVNSDAQASVSVRASFPGAIGRPYLWDPQTGGRKPVDCGPLDEVRLDLDPAGSALIVFEPGEKAGNRPSHPAITGAKELLILRGPWKLELAPAGSSLRIHRVLGSLVDFSQQENDEQLRFFGGVATYDIDFDGANLRDSVLDLGEVYDVSDVTLNGVELGVRWWGRHRYELKDVVHAGRNHLQVKVATMLANLMQHKKDDAAAQRWASWAPPIPAGLVGPVRLIALNEEPAK
jgi:alpha-L-rhamnosidase